MIGVLANTVCVLLGSALGLTAGLLQTVLTDPAIVLVPFVYWLAQFLPI